MKTVDCLTPGHLLILRSSCFILHPSSIILPNMPDCPDDTVLTGFLNSRQEAQGRPVGVAVDAKGALLVADDVGNVIWRVSGTPARP